MLINNIFSKKYVGLDALILFTPVFFLRLHPAFTVLPTSDSVNGCSKNTIASNILYFLIGTSSLLLQNNHLLQTNTYIVFSLSYRPTKKL
jgi:hypothetical protein